MRPERVSVAMGEIAEDMHEGLLALAVGAGLQVMAVLMQADVTAPYGGAGAFDRVFSTLHSNLPDREHRARALRWMADALVDGGRAVVSMHHHSLLDVVSGARRSGRYPDSGIYRYHMTTRESRAELAPWFARVRHAYIAAAVPGLPSIDLARAVTRVPLLRTGLSRLFLAVAERPIRANRSSE